MRGEFVELGGERLYYYAAGTRGAGDPVMLVHGFPTSSHLWHSLTPLLPVGRRLVVLDAAGCGRSVASSALALTPADHAAMLVALMDVLGIGASSVIAHGTGAAATLALLRIAPGRIRSVAFVSPADPERPLTGWGSLRHIAPIIRFASPSMGASLLHGSLVRRYRDRARGMFSADQYARPFAGGAGREVLMAHLAALRSGTGWDGMGVVPPGASIICGDDDRHDRRVAAAFARTLPSATLQVVASSGHFVPEEAPEQLATCLAPFFSR
jgi:pimeloyl-ACP methyl ester carboxylesterase